MIYFCLLAGCRVTTCREVTGQLIHARTHARTHA
eukprot:COSAG01_NODE_50102_length_366_cov_0.853933_1_plen_33_part_10